MQANKIVLTNFLNAVSNRGQFLSNKIRGFFSFTTIKGKIAKYLLDLSRSRRGQDPPAANPSSPSCWGGSPSVGRAMSEMKQDGLIRSRGEYATLSTARVFSSLLAKP